MELLLSVVDTFMLTGRGLALWPDLPLPHGKHNAACAVIVERPNGSRLPAEAQLRLDHFCNGSLADRFRQIVVLDHESQACDVVPGEVARGVHRGRLEPQTLFREALGYLRCL